MDDANALILTSGGIRQLWIVKTMLESEPFRNYIDTCDHILGTSAGALAGVLLALYSERAGLNRVSKALHRPHVDDSLFTIFTKLILNREILPVKTIEDSLRCAIYEVLDRSRNTNDDTVTFTKTLVVGLIKHPNDTSVYEEKIFEKNTTYKVDDVVHTVAASASILGFTKSKYGSDGAEAHAFPVHAARNLSGRVVVICPYPEREMMTPRFIQNTGWFAPFRMLLNSLGYTELMMKVGDDVRELAKRTHIICPEEYVAPRALYCLTDKQQADLTKCATHMAQALAQALAQAVPQAFNEAHVWDLLRL